MSQSAGRILLPLAVLICGILLMRARGPFQGLPAVSDRPDPNKGDRVLEPLPSSDAQDLQSPPPPSGASSLADRVADQWVTIVARHKAALTSSQHFTFESRFGIERALHYLDGRVWAQASPEEAEAILMSVASDVSREVQDRKYALRVLATLAYSGYSKAVQDIAKLTLSQGNEVFNAIAALFLYPIDIAGAHRKRYLELFILHPDQGSTAISFWPDPPVIEQLSKLKGYQGSPHAGSGIVMDQFSILLAPDCDQKLEGFIANIADDSVLWTEWAIQAARVRGLPTLKQALRKRLDDHWASVLQAQQDSAGDGRPLADPAAIGEAYSRGDGTNILQDTCHDQALLAYFRLGGTLTPLEQQRLYYHGYLGNFKQRLEELLTER